MFAYCLNNPIIYHDRTGNAPWRLEVFPIAFPDTGNPVYESEEDAAFAAGIRVRTLTNRNDHEYICGVYKLDCGGYTVGARYKGEHASASTHDVLEEAAGYDDRTLIAMVHSHPYCTGHIPNEFSLFDSYGNATGDFNCVLTLGIPLYLAAPNGTLYVLYASTYVLDGKWLVATPIVYKVYEGLPSDDTIFECRK